VRKYILFARDGNPALAAMSHKRNYIFADSTCEKINFLLQAGKT